VAGVGGLLVLDRRGVRYFGRAGSILGERGWLHPACETTFGQRLGPRLERLLNHSIAALIRNSRSVR
jgi:hypothetical protein